MNHKTIEVDTKTFVRFWLVILALGLVALFIWRALWGLLIVGIAIFLAVAIRPLIRRVEKLLGKGHSGLASVAAYLIVVCAIGIILAVVAPVVVDETVRFVRQLPETFENTLGGWEGINSFGQTMGVENLQEEILGAVQHFSSNFVADFSNILMTGIGTISQVITSAILVLVLTLLFTLEGPEILQNFWSALENQKKNSAVAVYRRITDRVAGVVANYVSKQVTVALLDGSVVAVVVFLLSLVCGFSANLALPMGLVSLIFYLIPMFGQIISCILISLLIFFSSPVGGVIFLIFYIIYAQVENNLIAPKLQGSAQGLPTSIILTAIVIGMYMFGLIGAIVAIPIAGCIKVLIEELPKLREAKT